MFNILFGDVTSALLTIVVTLAVAVYLYLRHVNLYWERRGIQYVKPKLFFGHLYDVVAQKQSLIEMMADVYHKIDGPFGGMFSFLMPVLIVKDPELLKGILIKDFDHFTDRRFYDNYEREPLAGHLFSLRGDKWRFMRNKITPTFTTGKLKIMSKLILEKTESLANHIAGKVDSGDNVLEVRDLMARYTTDTITSVAFGVQTDSINNPNEPFREIGRVLFSPTNLGALKIIMGISAPKLLEFLNLRTIDLKADEFIRSVTAQTVELRETSKESRQDFMQLMVQLRNGNQLSDDGNWEVTTDEKSKLLSLNEIAAQVFLFFIGGFETSSTATSFTLYELAKNQDIQKRLQTEIDEVIKKNGGKLNYDCLSDFKYLDKVFDESLRKYPPLPILQRTVTKDYKLPNTSITLKKGEELWVSTFAMHRDPKLFKDPLKFDPERFSPERKHEIIPHTYLPFGEGPRNCIGMRQAFVQSKLGIAAVVADFDIGFSPHGEPSTKLIPGALFEIEGGLHLKFTKRVQ